MQQLHKRNEKRPARRSIEDMENVKKKNVTVKGIGWHTKIDKRIHK